MPRLLDTDTTADGVSTVTVVLAQAELPQLVVSQRA
jgi:hypothetical protein